MSKIVHFIKEVLAEAKNITWPKKDTLIQLTIVVISISIIIAIILGGFDYLFIQTIGYIGRLKSEPQKQLIVPTPSASVSASPTIKN